MKIFKISAFKLKDIDSEQSVALLNKELKKVGFDLTRPIEQYKGINSFNYLFTQED